MATTTAPAYVRLTFAPIGETEPAPGEKVGPRRAKRIADATPFPLTIRIDDHVRKSPLAAESYVAGYVACHVCMWMPVDYYTADVTITPDGTGTVTLTGRDGVTYGHASLTPAPAALVAVAA